MRRVTPIGLHFPHARFGLPDCIKVGAGIYLSVMDNTRSFRWWFLCLILVLSGAAGLIYEVVWFQLLHLTIGAGSQSMGILLACYMGGLFLGSLACARFVSSVRNPVRVYAVMEFGIGAFSLALPSLLMLVRSAYYEWAVSPSISLLLRAMICAVLLVPPTLLMGATLPILARAVSSDENRGQRLGWLYTANLVGAVIGVFAAVLALLPSFGLSGTNLLAVGLNGAAALLAVIASRFFSAEPVAAIRERTSEPSDLSILLVYALNGLVSLSFQVVAWRLYSLLLGATTYAFGLMLGVFLAGLGVGSAIGSRLARFSPNPRSVLIDVQLATAALIGLTALVIPAAAGWLSGQMLLPWSFGNVLDTGLNDLMRVALGVFPAAVGWGMTFPLAVACLRKEGVDPARSVGRLYAFNTVGAVAGSLLTSFVLLPKYGSSTAAVHLVWPPLVACVLLVLPQRMPRWIPAILALAVAVFVYSPWPARLFEMTREWPRSVDNPLYFYIAALLPVFLGFELFLVRRSPRRLTIGLVLTGLLLAVSTAVPVEVYEKGRGYSGQGMPGLDAGSVRFFAEGSISTAVVHDEPPDNMVLEVNGYTCAMSIPESLKHLRLLGHLPVFCSAEPAEVFIVGMGAGVSGGSAALHDNVRSVRVAEIEPKVAWAARCFAGVNHDAFNNPKLSVIIDDGRHYLATTRDRFGVISCDPIAPFWMGSASLYTTEYYHLTRSRLVDGGIFMQWIGLDGVDMPVMKSLLASFREVYPEGLVWYAAAEVLLMGSTGPIHIDVAALKEDWNRNPAVGESLAYVGISDVEDLLSHFVCPIASLDDYLADATANRDNNLLSQYVGWRSYCMASSSYFAVVSDVLSRRETGDSVFVVPEEEREAFRARIRAAWSKLPQPPS